MWSGYSEQGTGSQERGPGGFSVNIPGVVQKPEGPQFVPVRAGGSMQSSGRVSVPTAGPVDNTLGVLAKIGQELLAPKIKEEQDRRFLNGMVQAASGRAMQEIIDEQPAYVTIFGEAPAVEGARAYTTVAKKAVWVSEQLNNMPELAKLDTNDLPRVLQESMKAQLTGDDATDVLIQKEMLGAMPDLIRQQTKARFLHLQKEAKQARITGLNAGMIEYDSFFKADPATRSVDEMDRAEQRLIELMTPRPGEDPDQFVDDLTTAMTQQLQAGNFSAIRFAYDNKVLDHMPQEAVNRIRTAAMRAAPQAFAKITEQMAPDLVQLATNPPPTVEGVLAAVNAINDKAAGLSGVPREYGEYWGYGETMSALRGAAAAQSRVRVGEAKLAAKVGMEAAMDGVIDQALNGQITVANGRGNLSAFAPGLPDAKEEDWNDRLNFRFRTAKTVEDKARIMNVASFSKNKGIAAHVDALFQVVADPKATWEAGGSALKELQALYASSSDGAKDTYFGDKLAAMTAWNNIGDDEASFNTRLARARAQANVISGEPKKGTIQAAVRARVEESLTDGLSPFDGRMTVPTVDANGKPISVSVEANIGGKELLAVESIVMGAAAKMQGLDSDEQRANIGLQHALQQGYFELHGGRAVFNQDPDSAKTQPLSRLTGQPLDVSGNALNALVTERVKALGGEDSERMVFRAADNSFYVIVPPKGGQGQELVARVTLDEIKARLEEDGRKTTKKAERRTPEGRAAALRQTGRPFPNQ